MLERSWQGRRVSVRRVLDRSPDGRLTQGDVVGDLLALDEHSAVIETRNGLVEVPVALVTLARLAPPSTSDELALESVAARGWRPAETEQLGGWVLRADHGVTHRANSVLPLRQPGTPVPEALGAARQWYARRGLPLQLQVPVEARRLLDAALREQDWPAVDETRVLAARLDRLATVQPADGMTVEVRSSPDDAWLAMFRDGLGLTDAARALLTRHPQAGFAHAWADGRLVAAGRGAVDDRWLGITAVHVDPAWRRQGLARAVTSALCTWGAPLGATHGYLQVAAANDGALRLYEGLGFWEHHTYHYRVDPTSVAQSSSGPK